jgi:hypothetical protein
MNIRFNDSITNPKECEPYLIWGFISGGKVKVKLSLYRPEQAWTPAGSGSQKFYTVGA